MSYKALYDILCSVKRHMNARVIFRCSDLIRWQFCFGPTGQKCLCFGPTGQNCHLIRWQKRYVSGKDLDCQSQSVAPSEILWRILFGSDWTKLSSNYMTKEVRLRYGSRLPISICRTFRNLAKDVEKWLRRYIVKTSWISVRMGQHACQSAYFGPRSSSNAMRHWSYQDHTSHSEVTFTLV